jgi:hypothetical protein
MVKIVGYLPQQFLVFSFGCMKDLHFDLRRLSYETLVYEKEFADLGPEMVNSKFVQQQM